MWLMRLMWLVHRVWISLISSHTIPMHSPSYPFLPHLISNSLPAYSIESYPQSWIHQQPNNLNCFTLDPSSHFSPSIAPCSPEWNLSAPRVQWHSTTLLVSPPETSETLLETAPSGLGGEPGIWSKLDNKLTKIRSNQGVNWSICLINPWTAGRNRWIPEAEMSRLWEDEEQRWCKNM